MDFFEICPPLEIKNYNCKNNTAKLCQIFCQISLESSDTFRNKKTMSIYGMIGKNGI